MKHVMKYFLLLCFSCMIVSCNEKAEDIIPIEDNEEDTEREQLSFDGEIEAEETFKVGDTVQFNIEGNADMIAFYSGTFGNAYDYIDKDRFYDVIANLSFQSAKAPDNDNEINWHCARLLYSTDFNGDRSSEDAYASVNAATWTDITDRFVLPMGAPQGIAVYTNSGEADIVDLFEEEKPVYLAWHMTTEAESRRVQFRVINSSLKSVVVDDPSRSEELYNQNDFNFQWILNPAAASPTNTPVHSISTTQVMWNGFFQNFSTTSPAGTHGEFKEGYAISMPLELPQFNAGKDKPTILLPKNDNTWSAHTFVYDKPGDYEVVFVASRTGDGQEEIIKKLNITIEEADNIEE